MVKVARFSNGFSDEYKGKRDVKAGWMITDSAGNVLASGHSIDRARAAKTAESHECTKLYKIFSLSVAASPSYFRYWEGEAKKKGFKNAKAMNDAYKAANAAHRATLNIEIVDVVDGQGGAKK